MKKTYIKSNSAFTLVEVMIAALVFALAIGSLLLVFVYCLGLNATSKNLTTAINGAQTKLEEIYNHVFDTIVSDYASGGTPGDNFSISDWSQNYSAIVEVDSSNPELLVVTVTVCWQEKGGRVIGEDNNLDGAFNVGTEDKDGDGRLDSPAQLTTLIARH